LEYKDGKMRSFFKVFYDEAMTNPKWTTKIVVGVKPVGAVTAPAGGTGLDYTIEKISMAANSVGAKNSLEGAQGQAGFCGIRPWTLNQYWDLTGLTGCEREGNRTMDFPTEGTVLFEVYKIQDDKLYLGQPVDEDNMTTVPERPTTFKDVIYTKMP